MKTENNTLIMKKFSNETLVVKKKHITLVAEPGSNYIGNFTPNSGKTKDISKDFIEFCLSHNLDLDSLCVIGSDGTNANTGAKEGVLY